MDDSAFWNASSRLTIGTLPPGAGSRGVGPTCTAGSAVPAIGGTNVLKSYGRESSAACPTCSSSAKMIGPAASAWGFLAGGTLYQLLCGVVRWSRVRTEAGRTERTCARGPSSRPCRGHSMPEHSLDSERRSGSTLAWYSSCAASQASTRAESSQISSCVNSRLSSSGTGARGAFAVDWCTDGPAAGGGCPGADGSSQCWACLPPPLDCLLFCFLRLLACSAPEDTAGGAAGGGGAGGAMSS
jgi:hypothetical protein